MNFASDNTACAHPAVMAALVAANDGPMPAYGSDPVTARAEALIRELLDAPEAAVRFVATGTAANALVCAQLAPSYGRIYCHADAHVHRDECGAPEFFSHGAKLVPVAGTQGRLMPEALAGAIAAGDSGSLNDGQNALVSLTNATEWGTLYSPEQTAALVEVAHGAGLAVHLDGARFANAVAALRCAPADLVTRAGVDALCLGGTKNGAMAAEAVVILDPERARGVDYRRKQAGHVWSKQRYLAAQMLGLLQDGLWLDLAGHANAMAAELSRGVVAAGGALLVPTEANEVFARIPQTAWARAQQGGARFHLWQDTPPAPPDVAVRLVTSWATTPEDVAALLRLLDA